MSNRIIKSMEHKESDRLLEKQEQIHGSIEKYKIQLDANKTAMGFNPTPVLPVSAYKISIDELDGFLVFNELDNYFRADFYPKDLLANEPIYVCSETPVAVREKENADKQAIQNKQKELNESQSKIFSLIHRQNKEKKLSDDFDNKTKINKIIGQVFNIPDLKQEYISTHEKEPLFDCYSAGKFLEKIDEFKNKFNTMPTLVLTEGKNSFDNFKSIQQQLSSEEFRCENGFYIKFNEVDKKSKTKNQALISILDINDNIITKALFPIKTSLEKVNYSDGENFDLNESIDVSYIDVYDENVKITEQGKSINITNSMFNEFFEEISQNNFTVSWEDLPSLKYSEFNGTQLIDKDEMTSAFFLEQLANNKELISNIKQTLLTSCLTQDKTKEKSVDLTL